MTAVSLSGGFPDLPSSVGNLVEFPPPDQIFLAILREAMPDVAVYPRIPHNALSKDGSLALPHDPLIIARQAAVSGGFSMDPRFLSEALMEVQVFATDPDGERKAFLISEACRVALRNAWLEHREFPGLGAVNRITMLSQPARKSDWATASGPVQYADLPTGLWRYETRYRLETRRPIS